MKRHTLYTEQYVDCEYDIDFNDIIEMIESCDDSEIEEIKKIVNKDNIILGNGNLYDEQKSKMLKVAFERYNLDELQEKLNIKNNEY